MGKDKNKVIDELIEKYNRLPNDFIYSQKFRDELSQEKEKFKKQFHCDLQLTFSEGDDGFLKVIKKKTNLSKLDSLLKKVLNIKPPYTIGNERHSLIGPSKTDIIFDGSKICDVPSHMVKSILTLLNGAYKEGNIACATLIMDSESQMVTKKHDLPSQELVYPTEPKTTKEKMIDLLKNR